MTFEDDRDRRRKNEHSPEHDSTDSPPRMKRKRGSSPEVGHALRAAYDQAVKEDIPPEMLALLGKLG